MDVGKSVSRVGGKAQLPAYRAVAGDLRLSYSQFQELEAFSRFGTRLDERTRKTLEHGYRVREVLKQSQFDPMPVAHQIVVLLAVTQGLLRRHPPGPGGGRGKGGAAYALRAAPGALPAHRSRRTSQR